MELVRFLRRLLREQPYRFTFSVLALGVVGLLEGIGVAALVPLFDLMNGSASADSGTIGNAMRTFFGALHIPYNLLSVLLFVIFFIVAQQVANIGQQKLVWGSIYKFQASLRDRLYEGIFRASWPFFVMEKTGDLINSLAMEADRAAQAYSYLNQMLGAILVVIVYAVLALFLSWQMTLLIVVVGGGLVFFLRKRVSRGTVFGRAVTELNADVQNEALENIAGAKLVKGCAAEDVTVSRFRSFVDRLASQQYRMQMNTAWLKAFYDTGSILAVLLGSFVAITRFDMKFTSLVVFLLVFYRVSPRVSTIQLLQHNVLAFVPAVDRIDELTEKANSYAESSGTRTLGRLQHGVVFDHVGFAYEEGKQVIAEMDLKVRTGKTTAIVGPSGAGKTTVVDLLMRLVLPQTGDVTADGVPMADLDVADWRRRIGYVAQDAVMFHATVGENIAWGRPGASREEVERAAELAFAHDFIGQLPQGYDTVVGDRGMRLSGGQKQRIALARALVRDPEILILDEATSALDAESERKIQQAIEKLAESVTIVIVTHRLATVKGVDYIYVLEAGRVVEEGAWDELVGKRGRFFELKQLQDLDEGRDVPEGVVKHV
jgi:ABC-type multidrug transport system fused ATPase/permease subunit